MGVNEGPKRLNQLGEASSLKKLAKDWSRDHDEASPVVAVDVSIFMVKALFLYPSIDQASAIPPIPVTHVVNTVWEWFDLLRSSGFIPIAVFDGQRYPPKKVTCERRYEKKIPAEQGKLQSMYSIDDFRKQQKKASSVCPDIVYEVYAKLKENDIRIVCAPFEADSQLVAMSRQNIVDFTLTEDSDIPFQGATRTIRQLRKNGKCQLVLYQRLVDYLSRLKCIDIPSKISENEIAIFSAFLGTDYVDRLKGYGLSKSVIKRMKDYYATSEEDRPKFLDDYV